MQGQIETIISTLAGLSDEIIKKAITYALGYDDWKLEDVKDRCSMKNLPKGEQIFSFDDQDLIHIYPPEFKIKEDDIGGITSFEVRVRYRKLYKDIVIIH